jgi:rhodanese-related sulfurtransferase
MKQFLQFVINHWMLSLLLVVILVLLIIEELRGRIGGVPRVSPQDLTRMMNREDAVVVDVRDGNAFAKGHIIGAVNIPHTLINVNIEKLEKYQQQPIVMVCGRGQTSPQEAEKLHKKGFEKIYFLAGGLAAWQDAGYPLSRKKVS